MDHQAWMHEALEEAQRAEREGEVPVGAVIVQGDRVVGRGRNQREQRGDPLAHAELLAISSASRQIPGWRLEGCTLYVTLEPCAMCAGALVNSRLDRLVFGASDPKAGFCGSLGDLVQHQQLNHRLEVVSGILEPECSQVLSLFFQSLRDRRAVAGGAVAAD